MNKEQELAKELELIAKAFGEVLKKYRGIKGWTQEELAFESNIGISSISRLERGVHNPTLDTLWMLARILDIPTTKLIPALEKELNKLVDEDLKKKSKPRKK